MKIYRTYLINVWKMENKMSDYIVYGAMLGIDVLYIGSGKIGRQKHCVSGRSTCMELNRHFFNGDKIDVVIFGYFSCKQESLHSEAELIKDFKPKYNKQKVNPMPQGVSYIGVDYPYENVLLDLTANETRLYKLILEAYNYKTGYSFVDTSGETQSVKTELSKGYKGLKSKGLVKRVKQQTYLINPCAKIHLELFDELYAVWNKLVD